MILEQTTIISLNRYVLIIGVVNLLRPPGQTRVYLFLRSRLNLQNWKRWSQY